MTAEHFGPGAYRGSALPTLAPPSRDGKGLFDIALKWGYYANLDSATEVERQLVGEDHLAYETQAREKRKQQIYCDSERWNFENSGKLLHFLLLLKLMSFFLFFLPWFYLYIHTHIINI